MSGSINRRQYLALLGGAVALSGCIQNQAETESTTQTPSQTDTLVIPPDETTTTESTQTTTPTPEPSETDTATSTTSPTPTPAEASENSLVVGSNEIEATADISFYESILWYDTGRLVLTDGATLGLKEQTT